MLLIQHRCAHSSLAYLFGRAGKGLAMAVDVHLDHIGHFVSMAAIKLPPVEAIRTIYSFNTGA